MVTVLTLHLVPVLALQFPDLIIVDNLWSIPISQWNSFRDERQQCNLHDVTLLNRLIMSAMFFRAFATFSGWLDGAEIYRRQTLRRFVVKTENWRKLKWRVTIPSTFHWTPLVNQRELIYFPVSFYYLLPAVFSSIICRSVIFNSLFQTTSIYWNLPVRSLDNVEKGIFSNQVGKLLRQKVADRNIEK
jgi:hypothetical protein